MSNLDEIKRVFGISDAAIKEGQKERDEMIARKNSSKFHCRIPDWMGQGGMVEFWINDDGTFECEDSRIDDSEIREGLVALSRW